MALLEHLEIKNFRGFDYLKMEGISKVNILVGKNSSGKTSILEAIFLLNAGLNYDPPLFALRQLNLVTDTLKYIFHNVDFVNKPQLTSSFDNKDIGKLDISPILKQVEINEQIPSSDVNSVVDKLKINYILRNGNKIKSRLEDGLLSFEREGKSRFFVKKAQFLFSTPIIFIPTYIQLLNVNLDNIFKDKDKEKYLLTELKEFNSDIVDVRKADKDILIGLKDIKERLSINVMGEGCKKFFNIIAAIVSNASFGKKSLIVCIDEIENGLHYTAHKKLWRALLRFADKNNVQLFITTHSMETLENLRCVLEEETKEIQDTTKVFEITKTLKGFRANKYDFDSLQLAIDNDNELRD